MSHNDERATYEEVAGWLHNTGRGVVCKIPDPAPDPAKASEASDIETLRAACVRAIECGIDTALGEVRRQGGPDYLLKEARSEALGVALSIIDAVLDPAGLIKVEWRPGVGLVDVPSPAKASESEKVTQTVYVVVAKFEYDSACLRGVYREKSKAEEVAEALRATIGNGKLWKYGWVSVSPQDVE